MTKGTQLEIGSRNEIVSGPSVADMMAVAIQQGPSGVEALEKLAGLMERETDRLARRSFVKALSDFRNECPPIPKTRANTQFSKVGRDGTKGYAMYAGLEDIDRIARPIAAEHGLIWTWDTTVDASLMHVTCWVLHVDGHREKASVSMPHESKAGASAQQKYAITQTYGMRYSLIAALGITTADDDVDGNAGTGEAITDEQAADIQALVSEVFGDDESRRLRFLKWVSESSGAETLADIPASHYRDVVATLERRR